MKWFRFYHEAIDDPKVQRLDPVLFKFWVNTLCLASRSDQRGTVTLSVGDIAFALRLTDDETAEHLDALLRAGLLDEGDDGLDIHNWNRRQFKSDDVTARVTEHRNAEKQGAPADATLPSREATPDATLHETLKPSARDRGDTETDPETEENQRQISRTGARDGADAPDTPTPAESTPTKLDALERRFQAFWEAYPNKTGKGAARGWWRKRKPSPAFTDQMLAAIEAQKHWPRWREGFIPNPATWLGQERWDDDMPAASSRASPGTLPRPPDDISEAEADDLYFGDL